MQGSGSSSSSRQHSLRRLPIAWVVIAVLLGEWACRERTLQVLEPTEKAPVASNLPPAMAGAAGAEGAPAGVAGTGPDAAVPECPTGYNLGTQCEASNECCSNFCGPTATGRLRCLPTVGCWGLGAACSAASDCCSLACVASDYGYVCSDFGYCRTKGEACAVATDCCSFLCDAGACAVSTPPACLPAGELCIGAADCCGTICSLAGDGTTRCQLLAACRVVGEICAADGDCCSGVCQSSPSGASRCGPAKACPMGDGKNCSRQVGDLCKNADECCSRSCISQTDGSMRCVAVAACRAACEICNHNQDCCSGSCVADVEGLNRCTSGTCLTEGEVCSTDVDCCQTNVAQKCVEEPAGQKSRRCRASAAMTECIVAGEFCALGSRCCSGSCAQNAAWEFVCAAAPVDEGQPCGTAADCSRQNSACVSLLGERRCSVVSPP
jgi:hypothetical protein